MKRMINLGLVSLIIPALYVLTFGVSFDAADQGWAYSLYHFMDYKNQIAFVLFLLFVSVVLLISRESFTGFDRKLMNVACVSVIIILTLRVAGLFFSLHSLSMGSRISSRYAPITDNLPVLLVALLCANVSLLLLALLGAIRGK